MHVLATDPRLGWVSSSVVETRTLARQLKTRQEQHGIVGDQRRTLKFIAGAYFAGQS